MTAVTPSSPWPAEPASGVLLSSAPPGPADSIAFADLITGDAGVEISAANAGERTGTSQARSTTDIPAPIDALAQADGSTSRSAATAARDTREQLPDVHSGSWMYVPSSDLRVMTAGEGVERRDAVTIPDEWFARSLVVAPEAMASNSDVGVLASFSPDMVGVGRATPFGSAAAGSASDGVTPPVLAFSALGLLGLAHAVIPGDVSDAEVDMVEEEHRALDVQHDKVVEHEAIAEPLTAKAVPIVPGGRGDTSYASRAAVRTAPLPPPIAFGVLDAEFPLSPPVEGGDDAIERSAGQKRPEHGSLKSVGPLVAVAGSDDALHVVTRLSEDTPEARLRLRRRVEQTAAEFGMSIGELQLNGNAMPQAFGTYGGSRDGPGAR